MKVYVEATCDGYNGIKKGDRFEVIGEVGEKGFHFSLNEELQNEYGLWKCCSHLYNNDWKRIEVHGDENTSLLTQIRQAKIAYDEAEEHLQSLLKEAHSELGDCGISFEIDLNGNDY